MHKFLASLEADRALIQTIIDGEPVPIDEMTLEERIAHEENNVCHICQQEIKSVNKVRDHDHFTGKYR